ncbi:Dihydrodipicolinate synthase [uncultured Clostridium sp.]|uniref:dihydrodipicolinate synthase family protein n=1 Tax=Flintibacter sp. HCN-6482 TaxID=3134672 RepID=UPI000822946A|nr:Dihydrodipicolinate synthase [uncultured Clostridium sp.]
MKQKIYGVVPPISTPIDEYERVDEKALRKLIDYCIEKGLHGIFVCGTNGECLGLTQQERNRAIRITLDHVAGRVPVLAGCMDTSTTRVIDNVKAFEQMGGLTAVVTPEFYSRHSTPDETIRHIEKIARYTEADIFVYNIPPFTGNTISAQAVFKMAEFDHVVGYKDTSGQFGEFLRCLNHFKGTDFMLFQGMTQLAGVSLLMGADGFIPNIGPVVPEICLKVYDYAKAGDIEKLKVYSALLLEAQDAFSYAKYGIAACKAACSLLGFMDQRMCEPSEQVTAEQKEKIRQALAVVDKKRCNLEW